MKQDRELNLALFVDFDNIALGARDARQRFDVKLLMHRVLEKGKIIVKRAYADWHYYKEHMTALHESAIELIEVPMPRISGKNSADIKMVVDAMDLCYSKDHIDAFVLVTGDSDFSPLVSKLRENDKRVIGIGMKNSSSKLLIGNCDEFIFYDDIYRQVRGAAKRPPIGGAGEKGALFAFLVDTVESLLQESRGVLYGSLIKDTMTRKQPDFNERAHGYSTFGDLLEEARRLGLLAVERDARAGGTWVVQGLGSGMAEPESSESTGSGRSSRRRRRSSDRNGRRDRGGRQDTSAAKDSAGGNQETPSTDQTPGGGGSTEDAKAPERTTTRPEDRGQRAPETGQDPQQESSPKAPARKTVSRKKTTKKTTTKKAPARKTSKSASTKKAPTKKAPAKKTSTTKKTTRTKAAKKPVKKTTKKAVKKTVKKAVKKTTTKKASSDD